MTPLTARFIQAAVEYGAVTGQSARLANAWSRLRGTVSDVWEVLLSNPVILVAGAVVLALLIFRSPARPG